MIDRVGAAIKDQLVLPAHLVHEQVRHARLAPGGKGRVPLHLNRPPPGRAIRHDQHVGARIMQLARHARIPDVLTDRDADLYAVKLEHRGRAVAGIEDALFVEHAIIGQLALVIAALDGPARQPDG